MSWPSSVIVNAVFIAVYVILTGLTLFNVVKHGHGKQSGFVYLLVFSAVRLIANILLVYTYNTHYEHSDATTWGYLLQGLGFSFLISASLGFYARAICAPGEQLMMAGWREKERGRDRASLVSGLLLGSPKATIHKSLHLINLIALILLIAGYNDSDIFSSSDANGIGANKVQFDATIKIGDVLYCILTAILIVLCVYRFIRGTGKGEPRAILTAMLLTLPFMLVRSIYVTHQAFSQSPLQGTLAVKVVLEYVTEVIVLLLYSAMGFLLKRWQGNHFGGVRTPPNLEEA